MPAIRSPNRCFHISELARNNIAAILHDNLCVSAIELVITHFPLVLRPFPLVLTLKQKPKIQRTESRKKPVNKTMRWIDKPMTGINLSINKCDENFGLFSSSL